MCCALEHYLKSDLIKTCREKMIAEKILQGRSIDITDGVYLFEHTETGLLAVMAHHIRQKINGSQVYYIKNVHIEPTNICIYNCRFCSFSRKQGEPGSWHYTVKDIEKIVDHIDDDINEVHITGGTHPDASLAGYEEIIRLVRKERPGIHIKAFSAAELYYVFRKADISYSDGIKKLALAGLNSIPGGGAEIFDGKIRRQICPEKVAFTDWIEIHRVAHQQGVFSNATMLYGHIENYRHRIIHMSRLRDLQAETHGLKAFIPLRYKSRNNALSAIGETTLPEDMRNYAVSRIFLDNVPHLKAYWPMLGKKQAQLALTFGVDDIDGTIGNSTGIYTAAGCEDKDNTLSADKLQKMIKDSGFIPVERYSDYSDVKK